MALRNPGPPGLLVGVTNELGGRTTITYRSSADVVGKAAALVSQPVPAEALPVTTGPLRGHVFVVDTITVEDGRPGTPVQQETADYAEPRYDQALRESLGFRMANSTDAASITTRSLFHQTIAQRGRRAYEEIVDGSGTLLRSHEITWTGADVPAENELGFAIPGSFAVFSRLEVTRLYDPADPSRWQEHTVERTHDPVTGNPITARDWGADNLPGTADDHIVGHTYVENFTDWLTEHPSTTSEAFGPDLLAGLVSMITYRYDGQAFGMAPTAGLVTELSTLRDMTTTPWTTALERWDYDPYGNPIRYWDARAVAEAGAPTWTTEYDTQTNTFPTQITNRLGHPTQFELDPVFGLVRRVLDANAYLRCWDFDGFGRLTARRDRTSDGTLTGAASTCDRTLASFTFPALGDPAAQHIEESVFPSPSAPPIRMRRFFDGLGREYQTEEELRTSGGDDFQITVRGFDARGRESCEALPQRGAGRLPLDCDAQAPRMVTSYDGLGRRISVARALVPGVPPGTAQVEIANSYGVADLDADDDLDLVETRDRIGAPTRTRKIAHDPHERVAAVLEGDGGLTRLVRDPKGRITRVDGPDVALAGGAGVHPNVLAISYDAVGQRTRVALGENASDPTWRYAYDLNGNLAERVAPSGRTLRYQYDVLDRILREDRAPFTDPPSTGSEDITYGYDSPGLYATGRLTAADTPALSSTFGYDLEGRLATKTRDYGDSLVFPLSYAYDSLDRRTLTIYPDLGIVAHDFDGSVPSAVTRIFYGVSSEPIASGMDVHASGELAAIIFGDGSVASTYAYHPDTHRIENATTTVDGAAVQDLTFDYDTAGNLLAISDGLGLLGWIYGYDAAHRLASATATGAQGGSFPASAYLYDTAGNLRQTDSAAGTLTLRYESASFAHAVTGVERGGSPVGAYEHDADGQVVERSKDSDALVLSRDDAGRVVASSVNTWAPLSAYEYDENGRRSRKFVTSGGAADTDRLYVDPEYEVDLLAGTHATHVFVAGRRIASVKRDGVGIHPADPGSSETFQYLHPDQIGSNALVTDDGGVVQRSLLAPFGEVRAVLPGSGGSVPPAESATDHLFTDQENDPGTELQYFGARYYDPWVGQFLSQDPDLIGPAAGVTFAQIAQDPQSGNAYSYVQNRPTVAMDPSGRSSTRACPPAAPGDGVAQPGCIQVAEGPLIDRSDIRGSGAEGVPTLTPSDGDGSQSVCPSCHLGNPLPDPNRPTDPRVQAVAEAISPLLPGLPAVRGAALGIKALTRGDEAVDLFRFVSRAELDDVVASGGKLRLGQGTLGVKQFGLRFGEVADLSSRLSRGADPILRLRVPQSTFNALNRTPVDPSVLRSGAATANQAQLDLINRTLIELQRVR